MGPFSSSNDVYQLLLERPSPVPIGVLPAFAAHDDPVVLKLQEKRWSLSGDDVYIRDVNNNPILVCKAKALSIHRKRELRDANGQVLFRMQNERILYLRHSFKATAPDDNNKVLFQVKSQLFVGKAKLDATFTNAADGQELKLTLRGDFFDRKASITLGDENGPVVGTISRSYLNVRQLVFDDQTYYLTVAPGVDITMLAALCVCMDEVERE